jgi:hypothetical protein
MKHPIFRRPAAIFLTLLAGALLAPSAAWAGQCTEARKELEFWSNKYQKDSKQYQEVATQILYAKNGYSQMEENVKRNPTDKDFEKRKEYYKQLGISHQKNLEKVGKEMAKTYAGWDAAYKDTNAKCNSWKKWWNNVEDKRPKK